MSRDDPQGHTSSTLPRGHQRRGVALDGRSSIGASTPFSWISRLGSGHIDMNGSNYTLRTPSKVEIGIEANSSDSPNISPTSHEVGKRFELNCKLTRAREPWKLPVPDVSRFRFLSVSNWWGDLLPEGLAGRNHQAK